MSDKPQKVPVNRMVYVSSGEVAVAGHNETLISTPLGSCVAVIIYDKTTAKGGMAHVMLPGKPRRDSTVGKNKYAVHAVSHLINLLRKTGVREKDMEVCLAGGANVLQRPDDTIARDVAHSTLSVIKQNKLRVKAVSLGGTQRRTAILNTEKGEAITTIGDSGARLLWKFFEEKKTCQDTIHNHLLFKSHEK